ncbi:MAG: phosphatidate cytidylyltransferase [Rhodospirillales bacterium]
MLGDLAVRFASAVALGAPFLLAVYAGPPYFDLIIIVSAGLLAWEWSRLTSAGASAGAGWRGGVFIGCTVLAVSAASLLSPIAALAVVVVASVGLLLWARQQTWLAAGIAYLALPCIALLWLREHAVDGRSIVFWLIAVVWASDVGAYFSGRILGGPKLAPAISPNKTWAGFFGGAAAAGAIGAIAAIAAPLMGADRPGLLVAVSVLLGISAQAGDLFESWLKRRFGVKDTSALIPGHGGILDRVDGLMAAALLLALIGLTGKGSMLAWL